MGTIAKRLARAAALARERSGSITPRIGTTAGSGVRRLRDDIEPRLRRYGSSSVASLALLLQRLRHSARTILLAGRRRARGLRKLSPDLISKAMDETAAQVARIEMTFFGMAADAWRVQSRQPPAPQDAQQRTPSRWWPWRRAAG